MLAGINTYAYVGSNPLSYTDPTGEVVPIVAGVIVGAVSGAVGAALTPNGNILQGAVVGAIAGGSIAAVSALILTGVAAGSAVTAGQLAGVAITRGAGGAVANLLGQGLNIGNPCYSGLNYGAVIGAAGGGVLTTVPTAFLSGLGLGARLVANIPTVGMQATAVAVGSNLGQQPNRCGCP